MAFVLIWPVKFGLAAIVTGSLDVSNTCSASPQELGEAPQKLERPSTAYSLQFLSEGAGFDTTRSYRREVWSEVFTLQLCAGCADSKDVATCFKQLLRSLPLNNSFLL